MDEAPALAGFTIAVALAAGATALFLSRHLRAPGIVILLFLGVVLGPDGLGWIQPDYLSGMIETIVGMAVAIILFEGGLHLKIRQLRREASAIRRLLSVGALVTAVGGWVVTALVLGWPWQTSLLFGALVIVTGPTVVTPLLRRLKLQRRVSVILESEGVLIDPIGAIVAVVALDIILAHSAGEPMVHSALTFFYRFGAGIAFGLVGGYLLGWVLGREGLIPDDMANIFALSWALFLFEASNATFHESGIMAITLAGVVVGNMPIRRTRELVEFNEQLTYLLIGMLFVLLAADVRLDQVMALGASGVVVTTVLALVVRPINIALSTAGTNLTWREKLFMSWLAPRGIVAAAVASLFVDDLRQAGVEGGDSFRAMVFMVIALTVVAQGFTAGPLASLLSLRQKQNHGFIIVGAHPLARLLARLLITAEEPVVLIDRNNTDITGAQREGHQVVYGNALEERTLLRGAVVTRRAVIGLTSNEGVNLMLLRRARSLNKSVAGYVALLRGSEISTEMIQDLQARVLFGYQFDFNFWSHRLRMGDITLEAWTLKGKKAFSFQPDYGRGSFGPTETAALPLVAVSNKRPRPVAAGLAIEHGEQVITLIHETSRKLTAKWLEEHGFEYNETLDLEKLPPIPVPQLGATDMLVERGKMSPWPKG